MTSAMPGCTGYSWNGFFRWSLADAIPCAWPAPAPAHRTTAAALPAMISSWRRGGTARPQRTRSYLTGAASGIPTRSIWNRSTACSDSSRHALVAMPWNHRAMFLTNRCCHNAFVLRHWPLDAEPTRARVCYSRRSLLRIFSGSCLKSRIAATKIRVG